MQLLKQVYFLNDWLIVRHRPKDFCLALHALAENYVQHSNIEQSKIIYQQAAELLWRGLIFKAKLYKRPAKLLALVFYKDAMIYSLISRLMTR